MRHAEVAETPAETRDHVLPAGEGVPVARGHLADAVALEHEGGEDRGDQQRAEHEHALEEVRPADGGKAAEEGIADDDDRGEVHGGGRVHADDGVEERAAGLDGRGGIDRVGHEEDHRAENLQRAGLREESVRQILGDGDRVACNDGEAAQARRLHEPADRIADGKAHADPDLSHAEGIDRGRQTHEHPRAHIGRAGGERRDPRAHLAAAEEVGLLAAGLILDKEVYADRQHENQVQNKYNNFRCFHTESPNQIFNIPCSITHFSTDVNTEQRIE